MAISMAISITKAITMSMSKDVGFSGNFVMNSYFYH
jgi:hypothetical protein